MSALVDSARPSSRFGLKQVAIGALLIVLGAVSAFALMRETRALRQERAPVAASPQVPDRPPLTAGEEAYAQALWDVHAGVRTEAVRMTFAGLSYKMGDIKRADVKTRVSPLTGRFTQALSRVEALKPPASLEAAHASYLQALRLYRDSSAEMVKLTADGSDEHLIRAQEMSEQASSKLMEVSEVLWPGEYKPN